jgi:lycopene cyclase domain-containing protein
VPGAYLLAILVSAAGIAALDLRWRLVVRAAPWRTLAVVALGTAFFLAWDLAGIAAGVFVKSGSPLYVGIDLAPHLPVEEAVFLAFLCYLALVAEAAGRRMLRARAPQRASRRGGPRVEEAP